MKLLLDENLPHDLRFLLMPMHQPFTVSYMGWAGIGNGRLISLAAGNGFDALITTDRGIEHEQNPALLACSVIALIARGNKITDLQPLVPQLLIELGRLKPKSFLKIAAVRN